MRFGFFRPLDENDEEILKLLEGKKAIILLNKSDPAKPAITSQMLEEKNRKNSTQCLCKRGAGE